MDTEISNVSSLIVSQALRKVEKIVKAHLLSVKDPKEIPVAKQLELGDELCRRERMTPMSSQLVKKVTQIYENCDPGDNTTHYSPGDADERIVLVNISSVLDAFIDTVQKLSGNQLDPEEESNGDTPLMKALDMGLMDMVWGFIECAKQTNSNLLTREQGDDAVHDFLWLSNERNRDTAFDVAIAKNQMEVASLLLNHAPLSCLEKQLNRRGKTILPLLNNDPKYDAIIFQMLEKGKQPKSNGQTSHEIQDDPLQESTETITNLNRVHDMLKLNPSENSILHIVSKFGDVKYVKAILENYPSMISCRNSYKETPAYVAASEGHADILQIMFKYIKEDIEDTESIVTRRMDNQNALHIAIQNHHVEVIFLLIEEIPQLANRINDFKESPIYIAAERNYYGVLELMLKKCKDINLAEKGPNDKTALHAAAISNSAECIKYLLKENPDLLDVEDEYGWTPFRYAVYHNNSLAIAELLNVDSSIGYELMTEDDIKTSAVHIAASRGHYETLKVLISNCPGCSDFIDSKKRNILHVAVENKKNQVIEFIFKDKSLTSLINKQDSNRNTPVHLLVASHFETMEKVMDFRVDINVLNNENKTPLDMTSSDNQKDRLIKRIAMDTCIHIKENTWSDNISKHDHKEKEFGEEEKELEAKRKEAEARFKLAENLIVVVTLIATASFAAGITLPGGVHSNDGSEQGTPFLLRNAAFRAFIVTDAIAFSCSCTVLLIYVALLLYRGQYVEASAADQEYINDRIVDMYGFTAVSLFAMAIAFVTGVYVVLTPSLVLAIFVCIISVATIGWGLL